jgi:aminoglycoside phosphotransferase (APT) family kinase protein
MSTISLDLLAIAADLRAVFPSLDQVAPVRRLGSGFGSVVVETAGGAIFRVARNAAAAAGQAKEARLLPVLQPRVSLSVPDPRWYAPPSTRFAFGVMGYPKLPGTPFKPAHLRHSDQTRIASDLGQFLRDLHRFPLAEAVTLGLPGPNQRRAELAALRDRSLPLQRSVLTEREYRLLTRWWDSFLADPRVWQYPPALCHGDLWYGNILIDEAGPAVTAVLDFENAAISDPAQDFATQLYLGEPFTLRALEAYRAAGAAVDPEFPYRTHRLWELREAGMPDDPAEYDDQIRKLRAGPILHYG